MIITGECALPALYLDPYAIFICLFYFLYLEWDSKTPCAEVRLSKADCPGHVQTAFKCLQGWRLHNIPVLITLTVKKCFLMLTEK